MKSNRKYKETGKQGSEMHDTIGKASQLDKERIEKVIKR